MEEVFRIRIQEGKKKTSGKSADSFKFWRAGCSLLRAEGFSFSLDVIYGSLGINNLQFPVKKYFFLL